MKKAFISCVCVLCVSINIAKGGSTNIASKDGPLLSYDHVHDFGTIDNQKTIIHTFKLQNRGNQDVLIKRIISTCGCLTNQISRRTIPPGKKASLTVSIDLRNINGKFRKQIFLETNDRIRPTVMLECIGKVSNILKITPLFVNYGANCKTVA